MTGDAGDKASDLLARVRAGEIEPRELDFAAYLRHRSARLALGQEMKQPVDIRLWGAGLARFGKPAMVRASHAMAAKCLPLAQTEYGAGVADLAAIVAAAEAWLKKPASSHEQEAMAIIQLIAEEQTGNAVRSRGFREFWAMAIVYSLASILGCADELPPDSLQPSDIWGWEEGDAEAGWRHLAQSVTATAWIADNSGRRTEVLSGQPCRAAINHTIGFLRSRLLDEKWRAL